MEVRERVWRPCLLLVALAVVMVSGCVPTVTPTPTEARVETTPAATRTCVEATSSFELGAFDVIPLDTYVCLEPGQANWQEASAPCRADWGYGVGTFLGWGAAVYSPDEEDRIKLDSMTEIRLPDAAGGTLELVGGAIGVRWSKAAANIGAIMCGSDYVEDPEFAVLELSRDAEKEITRVRVYEGEVTVIAGATKERVPLTAWQAASFGPTGLLGEPYYVDEPLRLEVRDWLQELGLPTSRQEPSPIPEPTRTPTRTPTSTPTHTPTRTPTPTPTLTPSPTPVVETTYRVGFCSALTGDGASVGVPQWNTAEMITAQLQKWGGLVGPDGVEHAVEVLIYNTGSDPEMAADAVAELIEEHEVDAVVCGSTSDSSLAVVPLVEEAGVPYVSMAPCREITWDPYTGWVRYWSFSTAPDNLHSGTWQATLAEGVGLTTICALYQDSTYGRDCLAQTAAAMEKQGIGVAFAESFQLTDDLWEPIYAAQGSGCNALIVGAGAPGAAKVALEARRSRTGLPVILGHGACDQTFLDLAGWAATQLAAPCGKLVVAEQLPDDDPQKEILLAYIQEYMAFTNEGRESVSNFGGYARDGLKLVLDAMESLPDGLSLEERRAAIRDYLETEIRGWIGVSGVFNLSADDHVGLSEDALVLATVRDGTWVFVPYPWTALRAVEW